MRDQRIIMCTTKTTQITTQIPWYSWGVLPHRLKVKMSNFPQYINDEELLL